MITTIEFKPSVTSSELVDIIKKDGIVILENFYSEEMLNRFETEFDRLLVEHAGEIDVLDKEDCSKDERIFHAQKYSEPIEKYFTNNNILCDVAHKYMGMTSGFQKTMINRLEYKDGQINNSGGGWHRDAHDIQFKSIMYLTDVDESRGNFQWITNSQRKHIGNPAPRTKNYDTRFSDEVINKLLGTNEDCELINVTGKRGTIIIANTSYIHRGAVIQSGERKAITQYYR